MGPSQTSPTTAEPSRPTAKRRGRPPGSVALTPEIQQRIVAFIRAGVFKCVAARAAGISPRTFHDWMARGEGSHSSRSCTRKLRAFYQAVDQALAEARASAEIRVHQQHPAQWLKYAARTRPDEEGWSDPGRLQGEEVRPGDTLEERLAALDEQEDREDALAARGATSECAEPQCPCPYHQRRFSDEFQRLRSRRTD